MTWYFFYGAIVGVCFLMVTRGSPAFALTGVLLFLFFHLAIVTFAFWWRASGRHRAPLTFARPIHRSRPRRAKGAVVVTILDDEK